MAAPGKNLVSEKEIFDYLMTKPGMDRIKAAGILANIAKESMYYSDAVENKEEKVLVYFNIHLKQVERKIFSSSTRLGN